MRITLVPSILLMFTCISAGQVRLGPAYTYTDFRWMKEGWVNSDKPFKDASRMIINLVDSRGTIESAYDLYVQEAVKNPDNALSQYKRANLLTYAGSRGLINFERRNTNYKEELSKAWKGLSTAVSPKARQFAKMRFVVEVSLSPRQEYLPIAKRLYDSDPNDNYVAHKYAFLLIDGKSIENCRKGISVALDIVKRSGENYSNLQLLSTSYAFTWFLSKDKKDAVEALKYFDRAIKLCKDPNELRILKLRRDEIRKQAGI